MQRGVITLEETVQPSKQMRTSQGTGLDPNIAAALSYLFGFVTGIIFLLIEKEDRFVRFHAMQSIIVFGALFIATTVINIIPLLGQLISLLLSVLGIVLWIMLMFKAYQGEEWEVPVLGKIAREQMSKV
ncbi:MAG: DUF4870 domain-containing protein [Patescibacteria group bacterium]|nr:DUF4870 domain-containing protein [Patescibacteria group bacterium]